MQTISIQESNAVMQSAHIGSVSNCYSLTRKHLIFDLICGKIMRPGLMRMLIIEDTPIIIEVRSGRSSSFGCCNILGPGGYFATRKAMSWRETSMTRLWERLSYTELTEGFCTKHEK